MLIRDWSPIVLYLSYVGKVAMCACARRKMKGPVSCVPESVIKRAEPARVVCKQTAAETAASGRRLPNFDLEEKSSSSVSANRP